MTQSEAFELLGNLIGKPLAVNGVHGGDLKLIAEAYVRMKDQLVKDIRGLTGCITRALPIPDDGQTVLVVTDDSGDIDEHGCRVIKEAFRGGPNTLPIPILVVSTDTDLNMKEAVPLVEKFFEHLPILKPTLFAKELEVLRRARSQLYGANPIAGEIDALLVEHGQAPGTDLQISPPRTEEEVAPTINK